MPDTKKIKKLKSGWSTNVCENVVRKIHEARSRQSHLQSLQSGLLLFPSKIFTQWPLQPQTASFSFNWSTSLYPPHLKNLSITPFFSVSLLLIPHLSSHLSILTKATDVCVCEREWMHVSPCCVLYVLKFDRQQGLTLLCLNDTGRKEVACTACTLP